MILNFIVYSRDPRLAVLNEARGFYHRDYRSVGYTIAA